MLRFVWRFHPVDFLALQIAALVGTPTLDLFDFSLVERKNFFFYSYQRVHLAIVTGVSTLTPTLPPQALTLFFGKIVNKHWIRVRFLISEHKFLVHDKIFCCKI